MTKVIYDADAANDLVDRARRAGWTRPRIAYELNMTIQGFENWRRDPSIMPNRRARDSLARMAKTLAKEERRLVRSCAK